jgi:hypothetical protein
MILTKIGCGEAGVTEVDTAFDCWYTIFIIPATIEPRR